MVPTMNEDQREVMDFLTGRGSLGVTIILGLLGLGVLVSVVLGLFS